MRAIQIERPGKVELVEVAEPVPGPDEVLVAVGACGICGTDLHILDGEFPPSPYPIVPGHEAAGTVVSVEETMSDLAAGDRVAIDPSLFCGACELCRAGRGNLCSRWGAIGDTRDGALAEYVRVPRRNLYPIPADMDFRDAALIEPVSCAVHALDRLEPRVGDEVLVCGAGTMGLIVASLLRAAGAGRVALVDRNEGRLEAAGGMGFADVAPSIRGAARKGRGFDKVVDATGVPAVIEEAIGAVRKGGTMMVFGVAPPGERISIDPFRIYNEEITIVGSMAVLASYGRAVDLVATGIVDARAIVTHTFSLDDFQAAFEAARKGLGLKVQIVP
ncbi:MAG: zinc-dependent alcohol dehydrogenase family protein [Acidimicrobiales bacterium]